MAHTVEITRKQVEEQFVNETGPSQFCAGASDVGLAPGQRPTLILTDLGNGQPLYLLRADAHVFRYRQRFGCLTLTIFND